MVERSDWMAASLPLERAVFKDASTTAERIPIMAMTTSNSISVKPRERLLYIIYCMRLISLLYAPQASRGTRGVDSVLDGACEVIDRYQHGREQDSDTKAEEDNHNGLNKADERVNGVGHFAAIELGER